MGNNCGIEVASTAAITFETEATLNKKRGGLKVVYSVVVHPRSPPIEIRNFVITMLEPQNGDGTVGGTSRKEVFLSKSGGQATTTTELSLNSGKTSLNPTSVPKGIRVGKPNLSISYSWSDRRTAKKEEEKSKKSRRHRSKGKKKKKKKKKTN